MLFDGSGLTINIFSQIAAIMLIGIDRHSVSGLKPLKHDRSGRVRYLDEDEEQQLRDALLEREEYLRAGTI